MMSMSINFCDGKFYGCRVQGGWNSRWYVLDDDRTDTAIHLKKEHLKKCYQDFLWFAIHWSQEQPLAHASPRAIVDFLLTAATESIPSILYHRFKVSVKLIVAAFVDWWDQKPSNNTLNWCGISVVKCTFNALSEGIPFECSFTKWLTIFQSKYHNDDRNSSSAPPKAINLERERAKIYLCSKGPKSPSVSDNQKMVAAHSIYTLESWHGKIVGQGRCNLLKTFWPFCYVKFQAVYIITPKKMHPWLVMICFPSIPVAR